MNFCPHCTKEIPWGATKCPHCTGNIVYNGAGEHGAFVNWFFGIAGAIGAPYFAYTHLHWEWLSVMLMIPGGFLLGLMFVGWARGNQGT